MALGPDEKDVNEYFLSWKRGSELKFVLLHDHRKLVIAMAKCQRAKILPIRARLNLLRNVMKYSNI